MRLRYRCLLLDAGPGRLAAVGDALATAGVAVEHAPIAAPAVGGAPAEATVILADAKDADAVDTLRRAVPPSWLHSRALVVLARAGDVATISRAVAIGADDAVCLPLDERELLERLDFAATLAQTRAEAAARDEILAAFGTGPAEALRPGLGSVAAGARVLMVGKPGPAQTQLVAALGGALLAYAQDETLPAALAAGAPFDLLVRSGATPWPGLDLDAPQPPVVLVSPREAQSHTAPEAATQPLTVIRTPLPVDLVRLRLEAALRLARLRQHLRRPPASEAESLAHDALTTFASQAFLLAYAERLDATPGRRPRVVVGLAPADFERWGRTYGHPRASRALAAVGREVRRVVRAEDFAAHVGEGRSILIVEADLDGAAALRRRIVAAAGRAAARVLGGEPAFETTAEPLRPGEPTRRAFERAFLNLRAARALVV